MPKTLAAIPTDATVAYTPSALPAQPVVFPGRYAVIGSGEQSGPNTKQTLIGLSQGIGSRAGRYVTLSEQEVTQNNPFVLRNNGAAPSFTPAAPVVLAIDTPQRLSVSEPVNGYSQYEKTPNGPVTYSAATEQVQPNDRHPAGLAARPDLIPNGGGNEAGISKVMNNDGTYQGFRIVYLQRLADPTQAWNATCESLPHH